MKTNLLILLGLIALIVTYTLFTNRHAVINGLSNDAPPIIRAGHVAPDFTFTDINGHKRALSDFKGKAVILNFWASWCAPCVAEFPDLLKLAAHFPDSAVLLAVSSDHDPAAMDRFLGKLKKENGALATAPNIVIMRDADFSITQTLFQTTRLPETILIDADQVMRDKIVGATAWNGEPMIEKIATFTGKSP